MSQKIKFGRGSCTFSSTDSIMKSVALLPKVLVTPEKVFSVYGSDEVIMLKLKKTQI